MRGETITSLRNAVFRPWLVFALGAMLGMVVDRNVMVWSKRIPPNELRLMAEAWSLIEHHYVEAAAVRPRWNWRGM